VAVAANTATSPRTATIAIGGQTATVTQAAIPGTVNIINPLAISTLAGTAHQSGFADGTKGAALFANPTGGAVDASGNFFVADTDNNVIRKVTSAGVVTTIAGKAGVQGYVDGTGTAALFNSPVGVAVDSFGNVYVADTMNNVLREITPSGVVTTLAGSATAGISDGVGVAAGFNGPQGLTADIAGNLYVADTSNHPQSGDFHQGRGHTGRQCRILRKLGRGRLNCPVQLSVRSGGGCVWQRVCRRHGELRHPQNPAVRTGEHVGRTSRHSRSR
jgi:secreted PhoX family phosphatase